MDEPASYYDVTFVMKPDSHVCIEHEGDGRISLYLCESTDDDPPMVELTHAADDRRTAAAFLLSLSLHAQHMASLLGYPDAAQFASELKVFGKPADAAT